MIRSHFSLKNWLTLFITFSSGSVTTSGMILQQFLDVLRKITTMESDLSKIVPATLLKLLSVMDNLLEVLQEFNKSGFQYKKHLLAAFSQA